MSSYEQLARELRELIDRHVSPTKFDANWLNMQLALQQEVIRLDDESEKFSDEEIEIAFDSADVKRDYDLERLVVWR